jgi:hypothetical protein
VKGPLRRRPDDCLRDIMRPSSSIPILQVIFVLYYFCLDVLVVHPFVSVNVVEGRGWISSIPVSHLNR